jgi:hypothetical protein
VIVSTAMETSVLLRLKLVQLLHQARFAPCRIAWVNDTPACSLVQVLDSPAGGADRVFQAATDNTDTRLFDQCAGAVAVSPVIEAAFLVLPDALECGFIVCHTRLRGPVSRNLLSKCFRNIGANFITAETLLSSLKRRRSE